MASQNTALNLEKEVISKEQESLPTEVYSTKRATSQAMEEILYEPIKILDKGFIRVVDYMGTDESIVQAARVSYGRGTKAVSQDRGLIRYLMRHWHTTPFEMCELKLHVKLPIFVARQWIRHRTANVNEYSARYSILDREFYIPEAANLAAQSTSNMQGRGDVLEGSEAAKVLEILKNDSERAYDHYMEMMNIDDSTDQPLDPNKQGLTRELARMNLPTNYYTQWYWKVDLHNLMHFVMLRADPHAQYEIRVYADEILKIMEKWVPFTCEAFKDYRMNSAHLSAQMKDAVVRMIKGENVTAENSGLTQREWAELVAHLGL